MFWLIITVISYFIFSLVSLVDKLLLGSSITNPKVYAFYVCVLGVLALVLVPFIGFYIPSPFQIFLSLAAGVSFIFGLFLFFRALKLFEPSRIVPAFGGILPVFVFLLIYIFSGGKEALGFGNFLPFTLLISGSILITYEKTGKITMKSLQMASFAAFFMAIYFVLSKYVFLGQSFWNGFVWMRIGGALMAAAFLLQKE